MGDMFFVNSTLGLAYSTLSLYNSRLVLWNSSLSMIRAQIQLYNSSILLLCDSKMPAEGLVDSDVPESPELERGSTIGVNVRSAVLTDADQTIDLVESA